MLWSWWRQRRRARLLARHRIGADAWNDVVTRVPAARHLDAAQRGRLRDLASLFLLEKSIEPARDFRLTDAMRIRIACEACVPVLELGLECYRDWYAVVVYPGEFIARHEYHDDAGVVHLDEEARAGESWDAGPVIVSWGDVAGAQPGYSVILHEMAHKLDQQDGAANGCPPLHRGMSRATWSAVFTAAFDDLRRRHDAGDELELDDYALEDPGEFFAVTSEYFFTDPRVLQRECPAVFEQLALYYRQQPG